MSASGIPQPVGVFGATGAQGGSVVTALLAAGASVVAFSRNPDSDKAKALAARGVEVRKGDVTDAGSLPAALAGLKSIFLVTDFCTWQLHCPIRCA